MTDIETRAREIGLQGETAFWAWSPAMEDRYRRSFIDTALAGIKAGMEMGEAERAKLAEELRLCEEECARLATADWQLRSAGMQERNRARLSALEPRTDEIAEAIAAEANCCGGIADDIYRATIAAAPRYKEGEADG